MKPVCGKFNHLIYKSMTTPTQRTRKGDAGERLTFMGDGKDRRCFEFGSGNAEGGIWKWEVGMRKWETIEFGSGNAAFDKLRRVKVGRKLIANTRLPCKVRWFYGIIELSDDSTLHFRTHFGLKMNAGINYANNINE